MTKCGITLLFIYFLFIKQNVMVYLMAFIRAGSIRTERIFL